MRILNHPKAAVDRYIRYVPTSLDIHENINIAVVANKKRKWANIESVSKANELSSLEFDTKLTCVQKSTTDISFFCKSHQLHPSKRKGALMTHETHGQTFAQLFKLDQYTPAQ